MAAARRSLYASNAYLASKCETMSNERFLYDEVNERVEAIRREVGDYQENDKHYPTTELTSRLFFTPHHSATEGRTLKQHSQFHGRKKEQLPNGLFTGRGWPGLAYTYGSRLGYGIVQAWPLSTVTYHCGVGNFVAVGAVVEGDFSEREPDYSELLDALAMKVDADNNLNRRLEIKYHDEWKRFWKCPGKFWPKETFAKMENSYYEQKEADEGPAENDPENDPPVIPDPDPEPEPEPEPEPDPDPEDPKDQPPKRSLNCLSLLFILKALIAFSIYIYYGL